jgi:serine protease Do
MADLGRIALKVLLGSQVCTWVGVPYCITTHTDVAHAAVVQQTPKDHNTCGWIGVAVSPMTAAFAESLGMTEPYGAIFDQPEPGSPAANAHIEQGDVLTAINGSLLMRASDLAGIISAIAPGATVCLDTWRDGEAMQVKVILGSAPCRASG